MTTTPTNVKTPGIRTCVNNYFIDVPLCRQETEYTCGVACVQSILGCYGFDYRQDELALILETKPKLGTNYEKIILFMKMIGFEASYVRNMTIDQLKAFINEGITPLLNIQAWGDNGVDYASDWKDSHYVIACGYDGDRIFFMDPWILGNYTFLPAEELLKRWHVPALGYSQCSHCGLVITTDHFPFVYQPKAIKYLG